MKKFSSVDGFKLILFPIEASIPRADKDDEHVSAPGNDITKIDQKTTFRISREELYSDVVDSTKLSNIIVLMTILSTVVVAIGLLKNNVAVIIGAMVITPFLGPNVALSLSTNLADDK
ncbi:MAG: hypothetical protein MUO88_14260 [Desulfobacterales bacterium]|nr:hypothetical protein [Desulfobacterales bacterium]